MQFQDPARPRLLGDQLNQMAELHRMARPMMEDLCVALWPGASLPISFFGLTQRLREAVSWVELWKCSVCLEGAREAYTVMKTHWSGMQMEEVAHGGPEGKNREARQYYEKVMPVA